MLLRPYAPGIIGATLALIIPLTANAQDYRHADEAIGTVEQVYDGALTPDIAANTFRNIDRLFPTRVIAAGDKPHPLPEEMVDLAPLVHIDNPLKSGSYYREKLDLYDYLALNNVTGMVVMQNGKVVYETYQRGNDQDTRWMSMSVAKSVTSTLAGAALQDGHIGSLDDMVTQYVPALSGTAYEGVSVRDVLTMTSGVEWDETYTNSESDRRDLLRAQIAQERDGAMAVMGALKREHEPGAVFNYSTGETQVLAEIVYGAVKRPLSEYLSEKIWKPYGMHSDARWWLDSPDGVEIGGSGIAATLRDFALFGQFILDGGVIDGKQVLPVGWTKEAGIEQASRKSSDGSVTTYGYMWWPAWTEADKADGAFGAFGIFGQSIYINPAKNIVIATNSAQSKPTGLRPIDPILVLDAIAAGLK